MPSSSGSTGDSIDVVVIGDMGGTGGGYDIAPEPAVILNPAQVRLNAQRDVVNNSDTPIVYRAVASVRLFFSILGGANYGRADEFDDAPPTP